MKKALLFLLIIIKIQQLPLHRVLKEDKELSNSSESQTQEHLTKSTEEQRDNQQSSQVAEDVQKKIETDGKKDERSESSEIRSKVRKRDITRECHPDLLKHFGMEGEMMEESRLSNSFEKQYCRRNHQTCCTMENFESISGFFKEQTLKLRSLFTPYEILLTLFIGPKKRDYLQELNQDDKCKAELGEEVWQRLTDYQYTEKWFNEMHSLLIDIDEYRKR